ncbi:MAG: citrate lyase subunit alpha [Candidatus Krumholzibacteriota bacterium]|nr:citrate lyase subunit alpha [Candidatus Krumholzibacteriota bacterium]
MIRNAVGRLIPEEIDGRKLKPFAGAHNDHGGGRKVGPPIRAVVDYGNKLLKSLDEAIDACQIQDGMTVSFHHHLRNGDYLVNLVVDELAARGLKDLTLAPSALFPIHESLVKHVENGVISHIEGSMNGPVGQACSLGKMKKTCILRSHGGRYRAIQDGDLPIDVAFIAAPAADEHGNCNGLSGPSACGVMSYSLADSLYADRVVVVTDNLVPFPNYPWIIRGGNVDYVCTVDKLGDPEQIVSGTTRITRSPTRLLIAQYAARFVRDIGLIEEPHFSFQSGAGGISLAFLKYIGDIMRQRGIKADFARGGSNKFLVDMLEEGLIGYILDGQCFDMVGARSLRENPNHLETDPFTSYNYHTKGNFATRVRVAVLGATEIDLDFNVNVNTHSDGWLLHGIGGFADVCDAQITVITAPLLRGRLSTIVDSVTTVTVPGETIDVLVTEHGLAVNPARRDILDRLKGSDIPLRTIEELRALAVDMAGVPRKPEFEERIVALIEYRDGTVIDTVRQLKV